MSSTRSSIVVDAAPPNSTANVFRRRYSSTTATIGDITMSTSPEGGTSSTTCTLHGNTASSGRRRILIVRSGCDRAYLATSVSADSSSREAMSKYTVRIGHGGEAAVWCTELTSET